MPTNVLFLLGFLTVLASGCSGSPGGPAQLGRMGAPAPEDPLQSNEIMHREAQTNRAFVKHVLLGWRDIDTQGRPMDPRAQKRGRRDTEALVKQLFAQLQSGAPIETMMSQFSEDPGSAGGDEYEVTPSSEYVFEFRQLALRLQVGEVGKVKTQFGWHIMKRLR